MIKIPVIIAKGIMEDDPDWIVYDAVGNEVDLGDSLSEEDTRQVVEGLNMPILVIEALTKRMEESLAVRGQAGEAYEQTFRDIGRFLPNFMPKGTMLKRIAGDHPHNTLEVLATVLHKDPKSPLIWKVFRWDCKGSDCECFHIHSFDNWEVVK